MNKTYSSSSKILLGIPQWLVLGSFYLEYFLMFVLIYDKVLVLYYKLCLWQKSMLGAQINQSCNWRTWKSS